MFICFGSVSRLQKEMKETSGPEVLRVAISRENLEKSKEYQREHFQIEKKGGWGWRSDRKRNESEFNHLIHRTKT